MCYFIPVHFCSQIQLPGKWVSKLSIWQDVCFFEILKIYCIPRLLSSKLCYTCRSNVSLYVLPLKIQVKTKPFRMSGNKILIRFTLSTIKEHNYSNFNPFCFHYFSHCFKYKWWDKLRITPQCFSVQKAVDGYLSWNTLLAMIAGQSFSVLVCLIAV